MKIIKKLTAVLVAAVCVFTLAVFPSAEQIDFAGWNLYEENLFDIATTPVPSNSGLTDARLKVKYNYEAHQMTLLFSLKFNNFSEEADNPGVRFALNGGDMLSFTLDGETECNEEKYSLSFISYVNPTSGVTVFEVTFGVKEGIPDERVLTAVFIDPQGIPSNTYTVCLSEQDTQETPEEEPSEAETKASKTKATKTKSSGKTQSDKTKKTPAQDGTSPSSAEVQTEQELNSRTEETVTAPAADKKVLFISAAAVVTAGLVLTGGLHFLKRKNHKGDKD